MKEGDLVEFEIRHRRVPLRRRSFENLKVCSISNGDLGLVVGQTFAKYPSSNGKREYHQRLLVVLHQKTLEEIEMPEDDLKLVCGSKKV